jgi:hypothetical protein
MPDKEGSQMFLGGLLAVKRHTACLMQNATAPRP